MYILDNINFLISKKEINKSELAKGINLSVSTVYSWYSKGVENISIRTLMSLSEYFEVTIDDLIYKDFSKSIDLKSKEVDKELKMINEIRDIIDKYKGDL